MKREYGQYFTTSRVLQEKVCQFVKNTPTMVLEPSVGRGDLVSCILKSHPDCCFSMYEIDPEISFLPCVHKTNNSLVIGDFLKQKINREYATIVGNPPYVKHHKGNLYIDMTARCFQLLEDDGELIFIVPSDFFKLTSASKLLKGMMEEGTFTHIFHPHNENLFENASIDVVVYRYCKNRNLEKKVLYNDEIKYVINTGGMITFSSVQHVPDDVIMLRECFDLYVGMVSGKDQVFRHSELGNIEILNSKKINEKFIFVNCFPTKNKLLDNYLEQHKEELINRQIRKFDINNWFEWGAPRNIKVMEEKKGKECIYVRNITRQPDVAFIGKVQHFGGTLIMLVPKIKCDLYKIVEYLNNETFKNNFVFSGRFKIGHRQLSNSLIDISIIH